jgi:hypothetical protein
MLVSTKQPSGANPESGFLPQPDSSQPVQQLHQPPGNTFLILKINCNIF